MSGNIISKLKNIRKEAQKQVCLWQSERQKRGEIGNYRYQWQINDISDEVVYKLSKDIGIHANFITLDKFLRNRSNGILPRQLGRLAKVARKRSKCVDLLDASTFKNTEDLRLVRFV